MRRWVPSAPRGRRFDVARASIALVVLMAVLMPAGSAAEEASQPLPPTPPAAGAGELDAGRNHTCALVAGTGLRCWGYGGDGELGYGNTQTIGDDETAGSAGPVNFGPGRSVVAISAGHHHSCARLDDGSVRCWGFGREGELGTGNNDIIAVGDDETLADLPAVNLGAGRTAVAISAGGTHSCAILDGGDVRCWGYGFYGALGYGGDVTNPDGSVHPDPVGDDEPPASAGPVALGAGLTAVAISAGGYHTCAILTDGIVKCWGYGLYGQLGYGNTANVGDPSTAPPVNLGGNRKAVAISAGELHTCALLNDASVRCWGLGTGGRLGGGDPQTVGDNETPGEVPPVNLGGDALAISAGDSHSCALLTGGAVRCWGINDAGQLGYANTTHLGDNEAPGSVGPVDLGTGRHAAAVSAGGRHTCVRLDNADVVCWGYGANGRLGYCNERNVGDNETPAAIGSVPVDLAVRAPSTAYPGCVRPAAGRPSSPGGAGGDTTSPLAAQAARRRAFRSCLRRAARHAGRELRRARRSAGRTRARLMRHIRRHRAAKRRACVRRHGRTPGAVTGLSARAASRTTIVLRFKAAGTHGSRPPAARSYVVKQSRRPIRSARAFRRAQTLCRGRCRFPASIGVGGQLEVTVEDLRPRTTYYYAVAARDNVSRRLGPRSRSVGVRTR